MTARKSHAEKKEEKPVKKEIEEVEAQPAEAPLTAPALTLYVVLTTQFPGCNGPREVERVIQFLKENGVKSFATKTALPGRPVRFHAVTVPDADGESLSKLIQTYKPKAPKTLIVLASDLPTHEQAASFYKRLFPSAS